ncbi:MAG: iron chaperone [Erysipelotrichaceae bacterium]|nr:iron chaperone [Erysipelotrichaceae bacterium]MDP3306520.1 iron chaperone [Erysipelotrichaceae bacterium]
METFAEFLETIENPQHQSRTKEVLDWVSNQYSHLVQRVAWHQPMFTDHGTFIIGFSVAKHHLAVTPEKAGIDHFKNEIENTGLSYSSMIVRLPWDHPIDFKLLSKMIEFNIEDKKDCDTFWRK